MKCPYTLFYMKMPPGFSSFMLVALKGIMLFFNEPACLFPRLFIGVIIIFSARFLVPVEV
jgi:hypothetical protein